MAFLRQTFLELFLQLLPLKKSRHRFCKQKHVLYIGQNNFHDILLVRSYWDCFSFKVCKLRKFSSCVLFDQRASVLPGLGGEFQSSSVCLTFSPLFAHSSKLYPQNILWSGCLPGCTLSPKMKFGCYWNCCIGLILTFISECMSGPNKPILLTDGHV